MNTVLAALLLFGAVDVKTAQKGDLYDDSVVVTNVNEAAFVKWGTTSGKTLRIDGGYVSPTVATGGVDLVGSALNVKGSAQYPAKVTYWPKNMSNQGAYAVFGSGTGVYFPKNADMAAASVYGLQAGYESLDERLTRKFGGVFTLDTDNNGDRTAFRIGSRAAGTYVGPYSSIFGYLNEASAQGALAGGYESAAGGVYDFAWGRSARASAGYATALGFRPNATNETAFVWQGSALYGEGLYGSHGKGTFNVNPVNGYSGFYVGGQSLADKFAGYLPMTGTPPGRGLTGNIHFYDQGVNRGEIGMNQVGTLAVASWTNLIEFAAEVGGLTRSSELYPDDTRILTQAYAKDAYPILTNTYTKGEVDAGFVPISGTAEGKPITGSLTFKWAGSTNVLYSAGVGSHANGGLSLASGHPCIQFSAEQTNGTNRVAELFPDDSRVLTQDYIKDAYPILTNAYTKAETDSGFLGTGETTVGSSFKVKYTDGTAKDLVSNTDGRYWEFGGRADKAKGLAAYDALNGSPTNPVATISWSNESNVHVFKIRDANHTNAEAVASIADIDRKIAQGGGGGGGGGITNRIESVDRLNAIYADGSWVTRTNATSGVAVTNTICTVSNVVTTVNEVKRKFYDAPLQVEWRFEAVNGEFMMIATTNVNTEVIQ